MKKNILVVDDNPDIVDLLKARLEFNQFSVDTASDGQDAITKARQQTPDLVLMDVAMPKMGGGEAVRALRAESATKATPIIFVTAAVVDGEQAYVENGINVDDEQFPVISKPINAQILLEKIQGLLR